MESALKCKNTSEEYKAYTLLELLVVMSILIIFLGMSFASFGGLQNTIQMNEYTLTLEQNIVNVQRAAMLLERKSGENWIYGLGIDFSQINSDGKYRTFKWCSPFSDFGDVTTKSFLPGFNPAYAVGTALSIGVNGYLSLPTTSSYEKILCNDSARFSTVLLLGYETSITPPSGTLSLAKSTEGKDISFLLFESVSGRAFFYDSSGKIVNYDANGKLVNNPIDFMLTIAPATRIPTKEIIVENLSGRVSKNNKE